MIFNPKIPISLIFLFKNVLLQCFKYVYNYFNPFLLDLL